MSDAAYKRDYAALLKAHGICVTCGNADAEPGRIRCRACLDKNAEASKRWRARHPGYAKAWHEAHPGNWKGTPSRQEKLIGAGRLVFGTSRPRKPPGTCRRKDCWESAIEFSCWCPAHLKEMRERRRTRESLVRLNECASMARYSHPNGW